MKLPDLRRTPSISIGVAAKMLGISVSSIRQYEAEGLLLLAWGENRRRLLSQDDIEHIACIKKRLVEQGDNFAGLRRLLALVPCWQIKPCTLEERNNCEAFNDSTKPCWFNKATICAEKGVDCRRCAVYWEAPRCTENLKSFLKTVGYAP